MNIGRYIQLLLVMLFLSVTAHAQNELPIDTVPKDNIPADSLNVSKPVISRYSKLYLPIVFNKQQNPKYDLDYRVGVPSLKESHDVATFQYPEWLRQATEKHCFEEYYVTWLVVNHPELVKYNVRTLPEPPKEFKFTPRPGLVSFDIEEMIVDSNNALVPIKKEKIKIKNWIHNFEANVQMSQAYLSNNWYQGGSSSLNLLGQFKWTVKLNPNNHPNLLFDNELEYKIGVNNSPNDSLRSYSLNEDALKLHTKFGVKAWKKWYYSATLKFKTQFFKTYNDNTTDLVSAFLSPAELNLGLGMTYETTSKNQRVKFTTTISPIAYNLKVCINEIIDETQFGIPEGCKTVNEIGSNLEAKLSWKITPNISLISRLHIFTDYKYLQGDWENIVHFAINKFLTTQIFVHARYDSSAPMDVKWRKWQLKEILSFGFTYKI